ncbi:hypothetical protein SELR_pSRC400140 (plasmid) [Selenomonas ruminantium subsp. lactilytica TAM6421]|uniref:Uncharacterized protein n=1 Tax=Selenomonas ruminantium subsp. lactilytica (strain NBRC 103574 / TAM6421) TaxID=927704 RepID=I0GV78_SELRL|nr:hypothetical protein [Selenomonas ruminantium]BAL84665.1 hypothetical protein SELR_pSRC400140 [Selenomonas ruminantium subsp. lactilytica TAM6421]
MNIGDKVFTPRFCTVKIEKVFDNYHDANNDGYNVPTYYNGECYVFGKTVDLHHMVFAAVEK